jgi:cobaltochelatase CobN
MHLDIGGWIEERMGDAKGDFQGGSIDVMTMEYVAGWKEKVKKIMNA